MTDNAEETAFEMCKLVADNFAADLGGNIAVGFAVLYVFGLIGIGSGGEKEHIRICVEGNAGFIVDISATC